MTGLCYRCEHRARYLEARGSDHPHQPRRECGTDMSVWCCYMYQPVRPMLTRDMQQKGHMPAYGPAMLASRVEAVGPDESFELVLHQDGDGLTPYWRPKEEG